MSSVQLRIDARAGGFARHRSERIAQQCSRRPHPASLTQFRQALEILALAACLVYLRQHALLVQHVPPGTVALWPASGVGLVCAAVIWLQAVAGYCDRRRPDCLHPGSAIPLALSSVAGNCWEAVLGCFLLKRSGFDERRFASLRDVVALGAYAVGIGRSRGSLVSSLGQPLSMVRTPEMRLSLWLGWLVGDATGILVVAPLLLVWRGWREFDRNARKSPCWRCLRRPWASPRGSIARWRVRRMLPGQPGAALFKYSAGDLGVDPLPRCLARPLSRSWPR